MSRRPCSIAAAAALCLAACLALAACTSSSDADDTNVDEHPLGTTEHTKPPSERDAVALAALGEIAVRDAAVAGDPGDVECWAPTENRIDGEPGEGFRVLCRVHYTQQSAARYRDMICIGDLARSPVADSCYQWAFYTDMPKFEDRPAYFAPAAS